jgi:hypothetical protein
MDKYIGIDVHAASCTIAVVDARGKQTGSHVVATNGHGDGGKPLVGFGVRVVPSPSGASLRRWSCVRRCYFWCC